MADPATGDLNTDPGEDIDALLQDPAKRAEILQRLGTVEFSHLTPHGTTGGSVFPTPFGIFTTPSGTFRFQMGLLRSQCCGSVLTLPDAVPVDSSAAAATTGCSYWDAGRHSRPGSDSPLGG